MSPETVHLHTSSTFYCKVPASSEEFREPGVLRLSAQLLRSFFAENCENENCIELTFF